MTDPLHPQPRPQPPALTLPDVLARVFSGRRRFAEFAGEFLTRPGPPSFYLVVWLLGMDGVAAALELEYYTAGQHLVDNWFHAWLRIMFAGVGAGVIRYWLAGTVFHGVVLFAGGHVPARTSRYLFLYAALPVVVVELSIKVLQMLVYQNGYFAGQTNPAFDGATGGAMAAAFVYTALLCYTGMRTVLGTERTRSLIALVGLVVVTLFLGVLLFIPGGG
jgi:hypothetical protein